MIVAPLMTPILGTSFALVIADRRRMLRSLLTVVVGAALVVAIGFLFGLVDPLGTFTEENSQVTSRVSPALIDLIAALATGLVGAFALVRSDVSDALPGVAIAISLYTIATHTDQLIATFTAQHGRAPSGPEVTRLRQTATLATRPAKTPTPLHELRSRWRRQAADWTADTPDRLLAPALPHPASDGIDGSSTQVAVADWPVQLDMFDPAVEVDPTPVAGTAEKPRKLTYSDVDSDEVTRYADAAVAGVEARRSSWTPLNLMAETARATRDLRMASVMDRMLLLDHTRDEATEGLVALHDPAAVHPVHAWRARWTSPAVLDAEQALLAADSDPGGRPSRSRSSPVCSTPRAPRWVTTTACPTCPASRPRRSPTWPPSRPGCASWRARPGPGRPPPCGPWPSVAGPRRAGQRDWARPVRLSGRHPAGRAGGAVREHRQVAARPPARPGSSGPRWPPAATAARRSRGPRPAAARRAGRAVPLDPALRGAAHRRRSLPRRHPHPGRAHRPSRRRARGHPARRRPAPRRAGRRRRGVRAARPAHPPRRARRTCTATNMPGKPRPPSGCATATPPPWPPTPPTTGCTPRRPAHTPRLSVTCCSTRPTPRGPPTRRWQTRPAPRRRHRHRHRPQRPRPHPRLAARQVSAHGVSLRDGTTAGVGDLIRARHNDRTSPTTAGRWVRNGDALHAHRLHPDGSASPPLARRRPPPAGSRPRPAARQPTWPSTSTSATP